MSEIRVSISELQSMNGSDMAECIRRRVIDMYERMGDVVDATEWLWKDLDGRQRQELI